MSAPAPSHDQSQLRRVGNRVRRPEDDDRAARSSHPPLPDNRNRKRQLPLQEQLSKSRQTRIVEASKLDERLIPKTIKPGQFSMENSSHFSAEIDIVSFVVGRE
jgi:hypothetical protein